MLSVSQRQAVCHGAGPCLTLAGPGSGKTYVLTKRICHLISEEGVAPEKILVITFSKAAAIEMKERFSSLMRESAPVVFGTFHSVFLQMLRQERRFSGYELLTGKRKMEILKEVMASCKISIENEDDLENLDRELSFQKNTMKEWETFSLESAWGKDIIRIFEHYEARKRAYRLMDFDDMLSYTLELFHSDEAFRKKWQDRFEYLLIDEIQDMNPVQYATIRMLALPQNNLFVVGDDDQSIYGFRGANPSLMFRFKEDYPDCKVVYLEDNYRCGKEIVASSKRLIRHNTHRFDKDVRSRVDASAQVLHVSCQNQEEEATKVIELLRKWKEEGISYCQMAVLFRNHRHCQNVIEKLHQEKMPFVVREKIKNPYQNDVMQDLVAYLRLTSEMLHRRDLFRVMNRPNRYLARASIGAEWITFANWKRYYKEQLWVYERIEQLERHVNFYKKLSGKGAVKYVRKVVGYDEYLKVSAKSQEELEEKMALADELEALVKDGDGIGNLMEQWESKKRLFEMASKEAKQEDNEGVRLFTIHSSKGLEFEKVIILGCNEGMLPSKKAKTTEQIEEERRLFYVGMTRAKTELYLLYLEQQNEEKISPSRFLLEMQEAKESKD